MSLSSSEVPDDVLLDGLDCFMGEGGTETYASISRGCGARHGSGLGGIS